LLERDLLSASLWVLETNAPARRFYEGLGGREIARRAQEREGFSAIGVAYGWGGVSGLVWLLSRFRPLPPRLLGFSPQCGNFLGRRVLIRFRRAAAIERREEAERPFHYRHVLPAHLLHVAEREHSADRAHGLLHRGPHLLLLLRQRVHRLLEETRH